MPDCELQLAASEFACISDAAAVAAVELLLHAGSGLMSPVDLLDALPWPPHVQKAVAKKAVELDKRSGVRMLDMYEECLAGFGIDVDGNDLHCSGGLAVDV